MNNEQAEQEFREADALFRQKKYSQALELLDGLDAAFPGHRSILYCRALCLSKLGKIEDAIDVCTLLVTKFNHEKAAQLMTKLTTTGDDSSSGELEVDSVFFFDPKKKDDRNR